LQLLHVFESIKQVVFILINAPRRRPVKQSECRNSIESRARGFGLAAGEVWRTTCCEEYKSLTAPCQGSESSVSPGEKSKKLRLCLLPLPPRHVLHGVG